MITIGNKGQAVTHTNYWDSDFAEAGMLFLTWNAGAARLLVPDSMKSSIREMKTAKYVIISSGPLYCRGGVDALELLFEDGSDTPLAITMSAEMSDRKLTDRRIDAGLNFTVWTRSGMKLMLPGKYRVVDQVPCLRKWS